MHGGLRRLGSESRRSCSAVSAGRITAGSQATSWRRRPPTIRRARAQSLVKVTPGLTAVAPCWGEMAGKVRAGRGVVHRFRDLVAHCRRLRTDLTHVSSSSIRIFNSEGCGNGVPSARGFVVTSNPTRTLCHRVVHRLAISLSDVVQRCDLSGLDAGPIALDNIV